MLGISRPTIVAHNDRQGLVADLGGGAAPAHCEPPSSIKDGPERTLSGSAEKDRSEPNRPGAVPGTNVREARGAAIGHGEIDP